MASNDSSKNTIWTRQNTDDALIVQAASRWFYNTADWLNLINWTGMVILAIVGTIKLETFVVVMQIIWFFVGFYLDCVVTRNIEKGTGFRTEFDHYVFGWSSKLPDSTVRQAKLAMYTHPKWVVTQTTHNGSNPQKGGVKDWYYNKPAWDRLQATKNAMLENTGFDKRVNHMVCLEVVLVLVGIITIGVINKESLFKMLVAMFVVFSVPVRKLGDTIMNVLEVQNENSQLERDIEKATSVSELVDAQNKINKKRLIPNTSPMFAYWLLRRRVDKIFHNTTLS